jgi:hypothetical protein
VHSQNNDSEIGAADVPSAGSKDVRKKTMITPSIVFKDLPEPQKKIKI